MKNHRFTLIELLVTIAIIVILAGILVGGLSYSASRADHARTRATMQQLAMALEEFQSKNGFYPPCASGVSFQLKLDSSSNNKLVMVVGDDAEWTLGRNPGFSHLTTSKSDLQDAWGKVFQYQCPGAHNKKGYDLWSKGKDGTSGNEDDIANWNND